MKAALGCLLIALSALVPAFGGSPHYTSFESPEELRMYLLQLELVARLVRSMIDARVAGVMFTLNPQTGKRDEFVIEANWGLGETVVSGAEELRHKESDRLGVMAAGLEALGADVVLTRDGLRIRGGRLGGGEVESHGDHRVAMAFAMAGLGADGPITVRDTRNVDTSFPGFIQLTQDAGLSIASLS